MKNMIKLWLVAFIVFASTSVKGQTDERNKIQMTIMHEGKTITTELSGVGFSISRYKDLEPAPDAATTAGTKEKTVITGNYYLTLNIKKVNNDFLKLMSKKSTVFNGTITVTDTYGKNAPKEIKFSNASLESYSDQFSTMSYEDAYSSSGVSLSAKSITINGVVME
ncbi:MAG: hypothetical protein EOO45_07965 [Flavobacterium sp.]|nr:MAG: hypothetical protein EOO45_07965 [Flavobacterium sp.]